MRFNWLNSFRVDPGIAARCGKYGTFKLEMRTVLLNGAVLPCKYQYFFDLHTDFLGTNDWFTVYSRNIEFNFEIFYKRNGHRYIYTTYLAVTLRTFDCPQCDLLCKDALVKY